MKIRRKALLYDIANMAYTIADTGEDNRHTLHRVRDICEDGNIDRVNRILQLAYTKVLTVLLPIGAPPRLEGASALDFFFHLRKDGALKFSLTKERIMHIKETVHEFMVSMVLYDWLSITLPEAADVWKFKFETCLEALSDLVSEVSISSFLRGFRRCVPPI